MNLYWLVESMAPKGRFCVSSIFTTLSVVLCLLITSMGQAIEIKPWFGRDKELEWRVFFQDQYYRRFQNGRQSVYMPSNTLLIGSNLDCSPSPEWDFQTEIVTGTTRQNNFLLDHGALTARYLILNDVIGDPFSLVAGFTAMFPTRQSIDDYSLFHCGKYEWLAHLSVGKETACESFWTTRWWATLTMGIANRGAPWTCLHAAWEKNWNDCRQFYLFADTVIGWGSRNVNLDSPFRGYGSIRHRAVDIGAGYSVLADDGERVSLDYSYRVYAHNRPSGVQQVQLTFMTTLPLPNMPYSLTTSDSTEDPCP